MSLKIAICDDEQIICNEIKKQLIQLKPTYKIEIFNSGEQLLKSRAEFNLIFLDIEMDGLNGMETAEQLRKNKSNVFIIFLTSHVEFMPDAFKVKAFRFLDKPLNIEKFHEAVEQAEKEILNNKKLTVNIKGKIELINIHDIIFFEAFGDGTYIHTKNAVLENNNQLKYWIDKVGTDGFFQTHKSYFVAFRHVKSIDNDCMTMNYSKQSVLISRRNYSSFKTAFFDYIKKNATFM